jgi:hypothetical protein
MPNQSVIAYKLEDRVIAAYNYGDCHPNQFTSILKQHTTIESIHLLFEEEPMNIALDSIEEDCLLDCLAYVNHVYLFDKIWFYFDNESDSFIEL